MQRVEKVVALSEHEVTKSKANNDNWRKRIAMQVAMQLPDKYEDAKAVLRFADKLLDGFLAERG